MSEKTFSIDDTPIISEQCSDCDRYKPTGDTRETFMLHTCPKFKKIPDEYWNNEKKCPHFTPFQRKKKSE